MNIDYEKLNDYIDRDFQDMKKFKERSYIYSVNDQYRQKVKKINNSKIRNVNRKVNKEQVISTVLNFYQDLDIDLYNHVKDIIMGKSEIPIFIYNVNDKQNNFQEKDKEVFDGNSRLDSCSKSILLSPDGKQHFFKNGTSKLYIALSGDIKDYYKLAHELAHTFQNDSELISPKRSYELLSELAPIVIENLLDDYLVKNNLVTEKEVLNRRVLSDMSMQFVSTINFLRMELALQKCEEDEITEKDFFDILDLYNINMNPTLSEVMFLSMQNDSIDFTTRYVIAHLLSPTIYKNYKSNPENTVQQFKKMCENIKRDNYMEIALQDVGINMWDFDTIVNDKNLYINENERKLYELSNSMGER